VSRWRGRARHRQAWILALIVIDISLGSALYASNGGGPVVLAAVISLIFGAFMASRRRTRSH
jgi:hypothetical protein